MGAVGCPRSPLAGASGGCPLPPAQRVHRTVFLGGSTGYESSTPLSWGLTPCGGRASPHWLLCRNLRRPATLGRRFEPQVGSVNTDRPVAIFGSLASYWNCFSLFFSPLVLFYVIYLFFGLGLEHRVFSMLGRCLRELYQLQPQKLELSSAQHAGNGSAIFPQPPPLEQGSPWLPLVPKKQSRLLVAAQRFGLICPPLSPRQPASSSVSTASSNPRVSYPRPFAHMVPSAWNTLPQDSSS